MNKDLKVFIKELSEQEKTKLIKMIWEDRVSYKEIEKVYKLAPNQVENVARGIMQEKDFKRWRLRQQKRSTLKGKRIEED
jgi:uncharacterized protein (TIGR03643 family)